MMLDDPTTDFPRTAPFLCASEARREDASIVEAEAAHLKCAVRGGWRMARTAPGAFASPPDQDLEWHPAIVPGTVASSLEAAGLWQVDAPQSLDDSDFWYATTVQAEGPHVLRCHGLATLAEVWLNGDKVLSSDNMFLRHDIACDLSGSSDLALCFRSLKPRLEKPLRRARWRSRLVQPPALRGVRTSLIGHMPGWCPPVTPVGPWREIELVPAEAALWLDRAVRTSLEGTTGIVEITFPRPLPPGTTLHCTGASAPFVRRDDGQSSARLEIPDVALWWPHTHGTPSLHALAILAGGQTIPLGRVGFRHIELDRDMDGQGFGLKINGCEIFARGSVWTPDVTALPGTREACQPVLALMRAAGMNMVRIGGTFVYEAKAFFDLCDEMGILVWQDLMFANLDYPFDDPAFRASAEAEVRQVLRDTQASPALAVVCGGSEVFQQAVMMGRPPQSLAGGWYETSLPDVVAQARPDALFLPNTPFGGAMPFMPQAGVCHYYGVSAYKRPLEDVRAANVRFASECLGFANVPDGPLPFEPGAARLQQACWGERIPHDAGAAWYFEDVRNHYIGYLYGITPEAALAEGPERYLALSRAVNAELMEAVFAEFRRPGSPARGGLTWFLRDVHPGAGWGLLDHAAQPKSVWHALRRACRPVQVLLSDEGLNGLDAHVLNETALPLDLTLKLQCLAEGSVPVMQAQINLILPPRGKTTVPAHDLWGAFFDSNYAYRFGPPSHDVTIATLCDGTGARLAEACHFPLGRGAARHDLGLKVAMLETGEGFALEISCQRLAQSVCLHVPGFLPEDNYFHLPPGQTRRIALQPGANHPPRPCGKVSALNGTRTILIGEPA